MGSHVLLRLDMWTKSYASPIQMASLWKSPDPKYLCPPQLLKTVWCSSFRAYAFESRLLWIVFWCIWGQPACPHIILSAQNTDSFISSIMTKFWGSQEGMETERSARGGQAEGQHWFRFGDALGSWQNGRGVSHAAGNSGVGKMVQHDPAVAFSSYSMSNTGFKVSSQVSWPAWTCARSLFPTFATRDYSSRTEVAYSFMTMSQLW